MLIFRFNRIRKEWLVGWWMEIKHILQNVPCCGGVDVLVVSSVNGHEKGRTTSIAAVHIMITSRIVGGRRVGRRWMEQVGSRRP